MENSSDSSEYPSEPTPMPIDATYVSNPALATPSYRSAKKLWLIGLILFLSSPLVAIGPFLLAMILVNTCPGGAAAANEANCGWAALPWAMIATIPTGIVMFIVGIVMMIIGSTRKSKILREGMR
ncbi:MAG: hypothetical protein EBR84_02030 [Actinobacteria bacterium]|nr:hypothetical protein [Actinomycetota bacterium]